MIFVMSFTIPVAIVAHALRSVQLSVGSIVRCAMDNFEVIEYWQGERVGEIMNKSCRHAVHLDRPYHY